MRSTDGALRQTAGGLYVPETLSRARQVWTRDETRLVERATKLLEAKGVRTFFQCTEPECKGAPMTRERMGDGGILLRCAHMDREMPRTEAK